MDYFATPFPNLLKEHCFRLFREFVGRGMNDKPDTEYYVARLRAEREAAATASSEEARGAHRALAIRYAQLLAARGHPAALEAADPFTPNANPAPNPEA